MPYTRKVHPTRNRIQISPKKRIAFVCSGGGIKAGAFHLGVALALQEQGFSFMGGLRGNPPSSRPPSPMEISMYVGSSAGSVIGSYLAAGYSLDDIFDSFLGKRGSKKPLARITYSKLFKLRPELAREQILPLGDLKKIVPKLLLGRWDSVMQLRWLKTTGLFSTAGIEAYMREEVMPSNRFEDYLADLFIVATQLNHSRKVIFGKIDQVPAHADTPTEYANAYGISQACAASVAIPGIFAPFPIQASNGKTVHFMDGEIRDTLSTHVAHDSGADLVIASYTHQPYHYVPEVGSLTELGLPAMLVQALYLLIERKITTHVQYEKRNRSALQSVYDFCTQQALPEDTRTKICEILERELHVKKGVDTIYIHPRATDHQMFTREHFSLNPKKMSEIVKSGFRAAIDVLRHYDFEDRVQAPAVQTTRAAAET